MSLLDVPARYKLALIASAVVAGGIVHAARYLTTPAYRAEAVVSPLSESGGSDLMAALGGGQLGGFGAPAGLGLGGASGRNERLARLSSRQLAVRFIDAEQLVPQFCGARVIKCAPSMGTEAVSIQSGGREANDARKLLQLRVLSVREDKRAALVRLNMTSSDREQSARDYVSDCKLQGGWIDETINAKDRETAAFWRSSRTQS